MSTQYEGYEKYLIAIENNNPMPLSEWKKAMGIKDEEEHVPVISRKSSSLKGIKPTLKAYNEKG